MRNPNPRQWRNVTTCIQQLEDKKTVTLVHTGEGVFKVQKAKADQFKRTVSAFSVPTVEFEFQVDQDNYIGSWKLKGYQNWHVFR